MKNIKRRIGCVFTSEGNNVVLKWRDLRILAEDNCLSIEQMYAELERLIENDTEGSK